MLAPERQSRILSELQHAEAVRVADLAKTLMVSEMTVRRDIEALEERQQLRRVHGGAVRLPSFSGEEPGFARNAGVELSAKRAIAAAALALVRPGMTVGLTGGTTTFQLAERLHEVAALTVVTNSLKAAEVLYRRSGPGSRVVVTGGERTPSEALVGPVTEGALARLNVDVCFMGIHGIDPVRGLTSPNTVEAQTNAAFITAAARFVVLADHSKFNVVSLAQVAPLAALDTLITDDGIGADIAARIRAVVPDLRIAARTGTTEKDES
jgi:DeoR/GlpR family transcriptional regulator of sugar metabolism